MHRPGAPRSPAGAGSRGGRWWRLRRSSSPWWSGGNAIRSLSLGDDDDASAEIVAADTATTAMQSSEASTAEALTDDTAGAESRQSSATTTAATATDGDDEALFSAGATDATTVGVTVDELALVWEEVTGDRLSSEESATAADAPRLASLVAAALLAKAAIADADAALEGSCVGAAAVAYGSELTADRGGGSRDAGRLRPDRAHRHHRCGWVGAPPRPRRRELYGAHRGPRRRASLEAGRPGRP